MAKKKEKKPKKARKRAKATKAKNGTAAYLDPELLAQPDPLRRLSSFGRLALAEDAEATALGLGVQPGDGLPEREGRVAVVAQALRDDSICLVARSSAGRFRLWRSWDFHNSAPSRKAQHV